MSDERSPLPSPNETCDHGLRWLEEGERVCALEYLNRFVAPRRVQEVSRRGQRLFLVFDSGQTLECCCENCGESHGDDEEFSQHIKDVALGRRALRFRLEQESGNLMVWFARGDHLHLHRNALQRFQPERSPAGRSGRSVHPGHPPRAEE